MTNRKYGFFEDSCDKNKGRRINHFIHDYQQFAPQNLKNTI